MCFFLFFFSSAACFAPTNTNTNSPTNQKHATTTTTETLRDIYHSLFGLGSLIQAAETAWGQNDDLYSESGHVLAAAMELHARIVAAGASGDEGHLPPGFRFKSSMPAAPDGCSWKWDFEVQRYASYAANGTKCSDLDDGLKYAVGIRYLPNGFELGYNHYVGRLGLKLPETAAVLKANPVDWFTFSWGLATLTHADTAGDLWRSGLSGSTLCAAAERRPFLTITPPSVSVGPEGVTITTPGFSISPGALLEQFGVFLDGTLPGVSVGGGNLTATAPSMPGEGMPDPGILAFGLSLPSITISQQGQLGVGPIRISRRR